MRIFSHPENAHLSNSFQLAHFRRRPKRASFHFLPTCAFSASPKTRILPNSARMLTFLPPRNRIISRSVSPSISRRNRGHITSRHSSQIQTSIQLHRISPPSLSNSSDDHFSATPKTRIFPISPRMRIFGVAQNAHPSSSFHHAHFSATPKSYHLEITAFFYSRKL